MAFLDSNLRYTINYDSVTILSPQVHDFAILLYNCNVDDIIQFNIVFNDATQISLEIRVGGNFSKKNLWCSFVDKKLVDFRFTDVGTFKIIKNTTDLIFSDVYDSKNCGAFQTLINTKDFSYMSLSTVSLTLPSYFEMYDFLSGLYKPSSMTYSSYDYMMSLMQLSVRDLNLTTQNILNNLSSKLNTLDNLNILSQADFTPLLQLSSLSDTLALLNPTIATQNQVTSELNSNVSLLLPVRAKYGQPVPPLSPATVKLSLINSHNLEITRLDKSKNSICYLTDKKNNLISYFYDIDYSKTIDLSKYSELWLTYAPSDYSISLQPLIGFDDK